MVKVVLIGSSIIVSQGFGMESQDPAQKIKNEIIESVTVAEVQQVEINGNTVIEEMVSITNGEQILVVSEEEEQSEEMDPVAKIRELEQKISAQQTEIDELFKKNKKLSRKNSKLSEENKGFKKGEPVWARNKIRKEALKYYNESLKESGVESEEQELEVKMLPNVREIEETLYEFFNNIDEKLPELETLKTKKLEEKEQYLNNIASVVSNLHKYMDECLIPFKHGYKAVYAEYVGHFVPCRMKTLMPTNPKNLSEPWRNEFTSVELPLVKVIEELEKQLPVIDALLQAAELGYQTEYKKDIFGENEGCHILYIEAWNEKSRKNVRLKEIKRMREEAKSSNKQEDSSKQGEKK